MDSLGRFNLFVHVAEAGSFVKASQQLGISASAVGKGIARLEDRLEVLLFRRTTRSISLTEEGAIFLDRCRRILCEIETLDLEFCNRSSAPRGKIKVTMPHVNDLFLPVMSEFKKAHPEVELEIDFTDRLVDLVNEGYDVAVRTGPLTDSQLMTRTIGSFKLILVASPDYIREHGFPARPADLEKHACLRHKFPHTGKLEPWPITDDEGHVSQSNAIVLCNNIGSLIYFVRAGHGIACLPNFAVGADLADGRLVQVLAEFTEHNGVFRAIWPKNRFNSPRVRAFIEFLASHTPLSDGYRTTVSPDKRRAAR